MPVLSREFVAIRGAFEVQATDAGEANHNLSVLITADFEGSSASAGL